MTQRATDLIGKPVVSADNGERLGTVSDLLLDDDARGVVGLVIKNGVFKSEDVLPSAAVQTLGRDAVVSRSSSDLIAGKDWRARRVDGPASGQS